MNNESINVCGGRRLIAWAECTDYIHLRFEGGAVIEVQTQDGSDLEVRIVPPRDTAGGGTNAE